MGRPDNPFDRGYFPEPALAGEDGLLAAGGSLDTEILLEAYSRGIFPWYSEGSPVLWWSPDPRMVLFPERFKVSKSLARSMGRKDLLVRFDSAFSEVIRHCAAQPRPGQDGTWITRAMEEAYTGLHRAGYAHSVEVYRQDKLVGGLYGISLGAAFFGESMFHLERDASKVALWHLVKFVRRHGIEFIDAQQSTAHLKSLGAIEVPRREFLALLTRSLKRQTLRGNWSGSD